MTPGEHVIWLERQKRGQIKVAQRCYSPEVLLLAVEHENGQTEIVAIDTGDRSKPESDLGREVLQIYLDRGLAVEVLLTPASWGCEITPGPLARVLDAVPSLAHPLADHR
jgi:hypothetical protein